MTWLDPRRVFTCDHDCFEEIVEGDLSDPFSLHSRCSVAVRDETQLVARASKFAHGWLCVSKREAIGRIDSPILEC